MNDLAAMRKQLSQLEAIRANGTRSKRYGNREIQYRADAELAAAIADLRAQIAAAGGESIRRVLVSSSKGLGHA